MNILSALNEGLIATIIGMGTVFLSLIVLSYVLDLFNLFSSKGTKKSVTSNPVETTKIVSKPEEEIIEEDDLELIAVISAAIAASLETTTDKLQIKSFRRVGSAGSSWNATGRHERLNNSIN